MFREGELLLDFVDGRSVRRHSYNFYRQPQIATCDFIVIRVYDVLHIVVALNYIFFVVYRIVVPGYFNLNYYKAQESLSVLVTKAIEVCALWGGFSFLTQTATKVNATMHGSTDAPT